MIVQETKDNSRWVIAGIGSGVAYLVMMVVVQDLWNLYPSVAVFLCIILALGACLGVALAKLVVRTIRIDSAGLIATHVSPEPLQWQRIQSAYIVRYNDANILQLKIDGLDKQRATLPWYRKIIPDLNQKIFGPDSLLIYEARDLDPKSDLAPTLLMPLEDIKSEIEMRIDGRGAS